MDTFLGRAGVHGSEQADLLASSVPESETIMMDHGDIMKIIHECLLIDDPRLDGTAGPRMMCDLWGHI